MAKLDLSQYSTAPLFNTKAVVQDTGVSGATLRAWERRYGVPQPQRTDNNYRLYSEQDMALICWLRERVEDGITISQAVELYRRMTEGKEMPAAIPGRFSSNQNIEQSYNHNSCQERLIEAFKAFDEPRIELITNELFAIYSLEDVFIKIIQPVMIEIGEQWHRGKLSTLVDNFTTNYVKRKIISLINAQPKNEHAPIVLTGCAPHEMHEVGILIFSLLLQRRGLRVIYLGQNLPFEGLRSTLQKVKPALVAFSAMSEETAQQLKPIAEMIAQMPAPRPLFAFGGRAFKQNASLAKELPGLTLDEDVQVAALSVQRYIRGYQGQ
jgi:methanogenic corrinoid protein MtbC1